LRLAERARSHGLAVSIDTNYWARLWSPAAAVEALREVLPFISLAFCGAPDESLAVTGRADPEGAAAYFLDAGAQVAAISLAADGAYVAWPGGNLRLPAVARRVDVVQGAGDAFAGGFFYAWLRGAAPSVCGQLATVTAGLKVDRPGALLGLPAGPDVGARARELDWTDATELVATNPRSEGTKPNRRHAPSIAGTVVQGTHVVQGAVPMRRLALRIVRSLARGLAPRRPAMPSSSAPPRKFQVVRSRLSWAWCTATRSGPGRSVATSSRAYADFSRGGDIPEYAELLAQSRAQALQRLLDSARTLGADAVVALRYTTAEVMQGMSEVLAYGTAVRLGPPQ